MHHVLGRCQHTFGSLAGKNSNHFLFSNYFLDVLDDLGFKDFFAAYSGKLAMDFVTKII
jgi:hypothetical protein